MSPSDGQQQQNPIGSAPLLRAAPLWAVRQGLDHSWRALRPLLKPSLRLTEAQAALAFPGGSAGFNQKLRAQPIARASAYRLSKRDAKRAKPKPQSEINCLSRNSGRLRLKLDGEAEVADAAGKAGGHAGFVAR